MVWKENINQILSQASLEYISNKDVIAYIQRIYRKLQG
jgi:hypothetical protein